MKVEFHTHTHKSHDCNVGVTQKSEIYKQLGFDKVYVTDHNRSHSRRSLPPDWEGGIEVSTPFGHIVLLGINVRPVLNSLWCLLLYRSLTPGCKIIVPHPLRFGTGLFREYRRKSVGISYFKWFLKLVDGFEYFNLRDTDSAFSHKAVLPKGGLRIIREKKYLLCVSDSHNVTDVYVKGTQIFNDKVIIEEDKLNIFLNSIEEINSYPPIKFWNILRVLRINILYVLDIQK